MKEFVIALAGNPNAGKTTIFNQLTGARQHVANYPGVTVEKKEGFFEYKGVHFKVVDLPGTYSLSAYSIEEIIARNFIIDEKPDLVVDIIDTSNLERNLYLAVQIMELKTNIMLVFNMVDEARKKGLEIKKDKLSELLNNIEIVETVGNKGEGIENLKEAIYNFCIQGKKYTAPEIFYGEKINAAISDLESIIKENTELCKRFNPSWVALKLIENDKEIKKEVLKYFPENSTLFKQLAKHQKKLSAIYEEPTEIILAEKRYGFISGACTEAVISTIEFRHNMSDKIDMVLTNRFLGIPIFLILMYLTFQLTFSLGAIPMEWIDKFFTILSGFIEQSWNTSSPLKELITQGIIGGVGSVLVFLPNIILLFLAIGILEFSGYMARAAFIIDKIMHKIGLHGKSFIPMLIGFGCNVPGIMATRTLNTKKERLITILILPLMSCGARLPIYLLIIPAFFPQKFQATIMWLMYLIGVVIAIISAMILNKFVFKKEDSTFIMELPPYRMPTFKAIGMYIWEKSVMYVKKAGTVILALSILLWCISYFPRTVDYSKDYNKLITIEQKNLNKQLQYYAKKLEIKVKELELLIDKNFNLKNLKINEKIKEIARLIQEGKIEQAKIRNSFLTNILINAKIVKNNHIQRIYQFENQKLAEEIKNSYIGRLGRFIAPVFKPLGFDWKITTAIISAIPAKEVFVSQLSIINAVAHNTAKNSLRDRLRKQYTPLTGFCIMLWMLIATPCIATVAIVIQETNSVKWAMLQFFGLSAIAYILTFTVFRLGLIFV